MASPALTTSATLQCPHAGTVSIQSSNRRVRMDGQQATLASDTYTVAGCSYTYGTVYSPCVELRWVSVATRVRVGGTPLVLQDSSGLANAAGQVPQGSASVLQTQSRVRGS